jgi:fumarylacetoacetate (FAA) hydrolase
VSNGRDTSTAGRAVEESAIKLATRRNATRDGELILVSRDLARAVAVPSIARTLQAALDDWKRVEPALARAAADLERGTVRDEFAFDAKQCAAPLPRAYHWADGSAYVNHVELVRKARGAAMPESFWTDPLMYQGGSDDLLGPCDDVPVPSEEYGIDLEAEVAFISEEVRFVK